MSWPLSVLTSMSAPCPGNPLKDYSEICVKYFPCWDNLQKSYFNIV